ncbi:PD-(D/E)XK nuclease domain-containing protein [Priestia megaterium]|uniref:PD-(D/E)XK nuclease domain-containing protein n=1 Tax=Priestia megaterium TaxID=1404 RepID=UPI00285DA47B|nr:hypothetical protein [Priestia megaterium]MDR7244241.1 hypothetical protein [Priestia megaterium]
MSTNLKKDKDEIITKLLDRGSGEEIVELQRKIESANNLTSLQKLESDLKAWSVINCSLIESYFSDNSVARKHKKNVDLFKNSDKLKNRYNQVQLKKIELMNLISSESKALQTLISEIRAGVYSPPPSDKDSTMPVESRHIVEKICNNFIKFSEHLHKANIHGSSTVTNFELKNEYDVQFYLHGILKMFFNYVIPEEPTPILVKRHAKMDFLLPEYEIIIEVKHIKGVNSLTNSELSDLESQLSDDIIKYSSHEKCKFLYFFIFDPCRNILDYEGFIQHLSFENMNNTEVKTIISR